MKVHITYTGGCVTGDSLVLMADGTYKQAKDVKLGDMLMTWSFEEGKYEEFKDWYPNSRPGHYFSS